MIKKQLKKLICLFPKALPTTSAEMDCLFTLLSEAHNIPTADSYKQAVAASIMHLPPLCTHKAPKFFAKSIYKAQANKVAYDLIDSIRKAQAEVMPLAEVKKITSTAVKTEEGTLPDMNA